MLSNALPINKQSSSEIVLKTGESLELVEQKVIVATLQAYNFNRTHTAKALGIGLRTLQRKISQYISQGQCSYELGRS